ncbi:hypothetical protein [Laspinema olomoucense]|uniref:hypothetical protein n=1 Tax=Laspinema olomoucense TaxID=3231600 RepID=UPI0021BAAC97|nr:MULTISPECIES: hypothetical protein [unclassified Laspinema]MCT7974369.1 hypothetical protein [Laspinema sp. D3d]MCT7994411.1 hypothetical protein [Laspinema sp. D3c]
MLVSFSYGILNKVSNYIDSSSDSLGMKKHKIFIATKTYPSISKTYRETVCTAGILLDDDDKPVDWIRIYPIRYRRLEFDQRYPRWSIIRASIEKTDRNKDSRLESYRIDDSSIEIIRSIDTSNGWQNRKDLIFPLKFSSIQEIKERGKSLGLITPYHINKVFTEKSERDWKPKQQVILDQLDLFEPPVELEKIPYKFGYDFVEEDGKSHRFSISDWEISELYRKCRNKSQKNREEDKEKEGLEKVKDKLQALAKKDLSFIVGNLKDHRQNFMIIGLFYPPHIDHEQLSLF